VLNGLPFSISAGVGFIALSGIAVLNGVVLVNYFNQLKLEGKTGKDLVVTGTLIRLRPVLMTALVAIFGFLPMMVSSGVGAEVQRPLASVVIGGVISSTILTLIVLPILYLLLENGIKRNKKVAVQKVSAVILFLILCNSSVETFSVFSFSISSQMIDSTLEGSASEFN
jgi:cobalt-zinc-cadmium resistance protein CzcA